MNELTSQMMQSASNAQIGRDPLKIEQHVNHQSVQLDRALILKVNAKNVLISKSLPKAITAARGKFAPIKETK
jgi:hypothetical protein